MLSIIESSIIAARVHKVLATILLYKQVDESYSILIKDVDQEFSKVLIDRFNEFVSSFFTLADRVQPVFLLATKFDEYDYCIGFESLDTYPGDQFVILPLNE